MAAIAAVGLSGCGGGTTNSSALLDRASVLPFENLSGDPALDRWKIPFQRAFQAMSGARAWAPDKHAALLTGASVITHGQIERLPASGKILVTIELFDVATHKLLQSASVEATEPLEAITKLSQAVSAKATPLGKVSSQGMLLWADVVNSKAPTEWAENCRSLLASEPAFGPAYTACENAPLSAADREAAADRGYANRQSLRPEEQLAVGELLFATQRFQQAADTLTTVAPSIPRAWNLVGYSLAVLGKLPEAKKALDDYRKLGGEEPNAVDSLGEIHYFGGKYAEAEKYFLEAAEKFPQTEQGRMGTIKAACMRALQGKRGEAEELAQSFFAVLKKQQVNTKPLEELWRSIILEQDPKAMREKIESGRIIKPVGRSS